MERIQTATIGKPTLLIDCTPKELREIADKLENASKTMLPGNSVVVGLSPSVSLHYKVKENFTFVGQNYRDSDAVEQRLGELH